MKTKMNSTRSNDETGGAAKPIIVSGCNTGHRCGKFVNE